MRVKKKMGPIQKRIMLITSSCLLGMCFIISSVSYYLFRNYLQQSLVQATETNLQLLSDGINSSLDDITRLVRFCQTNADIAQYIADNPNPDTVMAVKTHERMTEEYNNNPSKDYIPRMAVITNEHFLQIVNAAHSSTADLAALVPELPYFETLLNDANYNFSTGFIADPFARKSFLNLPIIRPITYQFSSVQGGFLFLEISDALFTESLNRYTIAEDSAVYITIGDHNYLFADGAITEFEKNYTPLRDMTGSAIIDGVRITEIKNRHNQKRIVVTAPLSIPRCYISQSISSIEVQNQRLLLWALLIGTFAGISAMGALLMVTLNKMISVPVSRLRSKMALIAEGDFSREPSIEWNHELGEIGRGINDLSENVLSLMQTRLEGEKQKRELEYKMLQSQINPHFIYNTLNSIKWMATLQGANGISEMTTALAKLMKSISKGTSLLIPIREELSLLQDYFTIQSYRYGGTITLDIQVEEDTLPDYKINKFTLQPLVENAIFHGIEPKGTGRIVIRILPEGDHLENIRIDVNDNGVGMSPTKAAELLQSNADSSTDFFMDIGISNVHRRLQYEFGEQYGITVESVEGEYTTMSIHIPAIKENQHV